MRALVTGATGFLGAHLVRNLVALEWDVHVVVRESSDLESIKGLLTSITVHEIDGEMQTLDIVVSISVPDVVFHTASKFLASHTSSDVESLFHSNLVFPGKLLEAMSNHGVNNLVNIGTSWQHYESGGDEVYDPVCLYAATKQGFEAIIDYYVATSRMRVATLKLFDTYGLGDKRHKLMSLLRKTVRDNRSLEMSPGDQNIDLLHISDVAKALVRAADLLCSGEITGHRRFRVCSGRPISLRKLVATIESVTGSKLVVGWGKKSYRPREVMTVWQGGDVLPGWSPEITLEEGIKSLFARQESRV